MKMINLGMGQKTVRKLAFITNKDEIADKDGG